MKSTHICCHLPLGFFNKDGVSQPLWYLTCWMCPASSSFDTSALAASCLSEVSIRCIWHRARKEGSMLSLCDTIWQSTWVGASPSQMKVSWCSFRTEIIQAHKDEEISYPSVTFPCSNWLSSVASIGASFSLRMSPRVMRKRKLSKQGIFVIFLYRTTGT